MSYYNAGYGVPPVPRPLVFASFGRRFGALLVDVVGIAIVAAVVAAVAGVPGVVTTTTTASGATTTTAMVTNSGWSSAIVAGISAVYCVLCWTTWGATAGQRMLGLHVFGASGPAPLPVDRAVLRWFALFGVSTLVGALAISVPDLGGVVGLVQLVWVIVLAVTTYQSPTKQGLHDRLAGSFVVHG